MGFLCSLFGGSARKLLEQMRRDSDVIKMAVAHKLLPNFFRRFGQQRGYTITAAVTNKLFGQIAPDHSKQDLEIAEQIATDILKNDAEVRYAALMACRAILLFEADRNTGNQIVVWDTIQWMSTIWTLPADEATPNGIRKIALTLHNKYMSEGG